MKLQSIILKDDDVYLSFQNAILSTLVGYGKMYELLHKQLYRKSRVETVSYALTINGRPAKAIKKWNIKSPSTAPYNYTANDDLGLNQLFMGQSPYATYEGDPKDGIYHDDCYIVPKMIDVQSYDMPGWFIEGNGHWAKYDGFGATLVNDVVIYEKTHVNSVGITVSDGWFYSVDFVGGSEEYVLNDVDGQHPVVQEVILSDISNPSGAVFAKYLSPIDSSAHGGLVYTTPSIPYVRLPAHTQPTIFQNEPAGVVNVYADGTAVQHYSPYTYYVGDGDFIQVDGGYMICPLVYTDTGDLVQNRVDFIDDWNDQFELYIHEDSYWYSAVIDVVSMVATIVIGYLIGGPLGAFGGFIGSVGARTGNTFLQIFGAVISLYSSIEKIGTKAIEQEAMESGLSARTAGQIAMESSLRDVFSHFISGAGLGNLASIGSKLYSVYDDINMQGINQSSPQKQTTTENHMKVYSVEDDTSGQSYIDKVMKIGTVQNF